MKIQGSKAATFAIEATRAAIFALSGPEVTKQAIEMNPQDKYDSDTGRQLFRQQFDEMNLKARAPWLQFNITSPQERMPEYQEGWRKDWPRFFYLDVILRSRTKVHAEWRIEKDSNGEWSQGIGRVAILDDNYFRGRPVHEVKAAAREDKVVIISVQRYTGFGVMAQATYAPTIHFDPPLSIVG